MKDRPITIVFHIGYLVIRQILNVDVHVVDNGQNRMLERRRVVVLSCKEAHEHEWHGRGTDLERASRKKGREKT